MNNFNFLKDNKNLKNIQEDLLYYIYASIEKHQSYNDYTFLKKYDFFKKLLN